MRRQGMQIGNEKIGIMMMLHLDKIFHRTEVISQVKVSCRSYSAYYCWHD